MRQNRFKYNFRSLRGSGECITVQKLSIYIYIY